MATKFVFDRGTAAIYRRFRGLLETLAEAEVGQTIPPGEHLLVGAALDTLAAIDSNDPIGAAYAAFRVGRVLEYQTGWKRKVEAMLAAKEKYVPDESASAKSLPYSTDSRRSGPNRKSPQSKKR